MTEWFEREAGSSVAQGTDDPTMLLLSNDAPDWVRLPKELGGNQVKVLGTFAAECPKCSTNLGRHYELDCTRDNKKIGVCECKLCGFTWYAREMKKDEKVT